MMNNEELIRALIPDLKPPEPPPQPLYNYLKDYISKANISFHTPGHKGTFKFPFLKDMNKLAIADIPDELCGFPGAKQESEKIATEIFGTRQTFYLVNGSTAGVLAMFMAVLSPGDKVLIGRNLHISVISALVMSGAVPIYIPVVSDFDGISLNVTTEEVEKSLSKHPDAKAVFITSPSYFGVSARISDIADITHHHKKILLVDEAWGTHFFFGGSGFPQSAIKAGADIVVQGAHKTLPTVTGTALLHINGNRVDPAKVKTALSLVETTSPNMLFYLTLENAIGLMSMDGVQILRFAEEMNREARDRIGRGTSNVEIGFPRLKNPYVGEFRFDPLKLLLRTCPAETGVTGYQVADSLIENHGIIPEMSDLGTVLFIFTGFEESQDGLKLSDAILSVTRKIFPTSQNRFFGETLSDKNDIDNNILDISNLPSLGIPESKFTPRDIYFMEGKEVLLEDSVGLTTKEAIIPYPPGIPTLLPGEIITEDLVKYHKSLINLGSAMRGVRISHTETPTEVDKSELEIEKAITEPSNIQAYVTVIKEIKEKKTKSTSKTQKTAKKSSSTAQAQSKNKTKSKTA